MTGTTGFTLADARALAQERHAGQTDKQGRDYYEAHLVPIADLLTPLGEEAVMVGVLHDIVEDTPTTLEELRALGVPEVVVRAVDSVTERPDEPYDDLIARACADPLGRQVKLADNAHNLLGIPDLAVTDLPTARRLVRKYVPARDRLLAAGPR